jgi:hypothetical protein
MTMKLKHIAAGVAMAFAAGSANAAFTLGNDPANGSSLFVVAWANVGGTIESYARNLGAFLSTTLNQSNPADINTATAPNTAWQTPGFTFTNSGDTLFTGTFGSGGSLITGDTIHWGVFAVDSLSSPVPAQVVYTTNSPAATAGTNTSTASSASNVSTNYLTALNPPGPCSGLSCVVTGNGQNSGAGPAFSSQLFAANNPFSTAFNSALDFWYNRTTSGIGSASASRQEFAGTWDLMNDGTVVYSVAGGTAPVPLPGAVWLLGSGLLGLATIARRRNGSMA